jgi:hypothetical protein
MPGSSLTVRPWSASTGETGGREPLPDSSHPSAAVPAARRAETGAGPARRARRSSRPGPSASAGRLAARCGGRPGTAPLPGERSEPARLHRGAERGDLGPGGGRRGGSASSTPPGGSAPPGGWPAGRVLEAAGPSLRGALPGGRGLAQEAQLPSRRMTSKAAPVPSLSTGESSSSTASPQPTNMSADNILGSWIYSSRTCCGQTLTKRFPPGRVGGVESRPWGRSWRACSGASSAPIDRCAWHLRERKS